MEHANAFEVIRVLVSGIGLLIDLVLVRSAWVRRRQLWASGARIGRGHIMARANVWGGATIAACHATLLYIAWLAAGTPDGPLTSLSIQSNVGQVIVSGALAAWAALTMQAAEDADILDQRNGEAASNLEMLLDRLDDRLTDFFERNVGRTIRPRRE